MLDDYLKFIGYGFLISFYLFVFVCLIALSIDHKDKGSFNIFRRLYARRYNRILDIYTTYPHALKKYCKQQNIEFRVDRYEYNLNEALSISKIRNDIWETLENEELLAIEDEYKK